MRCSPSPSCTSCWRRRRIGYAIRLPANAVLQERIGHLLTRPVGRPPNKPQVFFASFSYQAQSWARPRRVVAKVEWHQGELYPRVGFIVTSLKRPAERVSKFYNGRGTAEQWIRKGKLALRWTRLSCHSFCHNAVRLSSTPLPTTSPTDQAAVQRVQVEQEPVIDREARGRSRTSCNNAQDGIGPVTVPVDQQRTGLDRAGRPVRRELEPRHDIAVERGTLRR